MTEQSANNSRRDETGFRSHNGRLTLSFATETKTSPAFVVGVLCLLIPLAVGLMLATIAVWVQRLISGLMRTIATDRRSSAIDTARVVLLIIGLALSGASGWRLLKHWKPISR